MSLKINDVLVCDDIRNEVNGKQTIVGLVHGLNIGVNKDYKEDIILQLSFLIRIINSDKNLELKEITAYLLSDDGKELVKRSIPVTKNKKLPDFFNVALVKENIKIKDSTNITFKLIIKDSKDKKKTVVSDYIFRINVAKN